MRLKPEYQALADSWEDYNDRYGCSCHINPPCSSCTHEGNPICLEETPEAWEDELTAAVREVVENEI